MLEQIATKGSKRRRIGQLKFGDAGLAFNGFEAEVFYFFGKNRLLGRGNVEAERGLGGENDE
jgi:hypothetical protein